MKLHVKQTAMLIEQTGYQRRDPEVLLAQAELALAQGDRVAAQAQLARAKQRLAEMGIRQWDWDVRALEQRLAS